MKRIFSFCLALVLSATAGAQVFDHLALGYSLGTDGQGIELASPVGRHLDLRAGFGMGTGMISYTTDAMAVPEHPGNPSGAYVNAPIEFRMGMCDARLLLNVYPFAKGGFHFTVGAYMGSQRLIRATASKLPSDYNTAGIEVDDYLVKATDGVLEAYLGAAGLGGPGFAVKPYVGLGFGRAVNPDKRLAFVFDLGAQYQGKPDLWASGESLTGRVKDVKIPAESLGVDFIDDYGKYAAFWPTLNFHVYIRLF